MADAALTLRVELGTPADASAHLDPAGWQRIDVTNPLREIDIFRGSRRSYGDVDPGECSLLFDNENGFLDSNFAGGPYRSLLTPNRKIRIVHVRSDGVDQEVMRGNVLAFPVQWAGAGFDATTQLEVRDVLWMMGATSLPQTVAIYELLRGVKYPRVSHLFVLRESQTSQGVLLTDEASDYEATPLGTPERGGDSIVPFSEVRGLRGGSSDALGFIELPISIAPTPPWTYAVLVRTDPGGTAIAFNDDSISAPNLSLRITFDANSTRTAQARVKQDADGASKVAQGGPFLDDGQTHLLAMNDSGSTLFVYVDGALITSVAHTAVRHPAARIALAFQKESTFAMAMIWDQRIVAAQQAPIWDDIRKPWIDQLQHERLDSLISTVLAGLPMQSTTNVGVTVACLPARLDGLPLLDLVRRLAVGTDSPTWVNRRGVLRHSNRLTAAPPAALRTYGVGGVPVVDFHVSDGSDDVVTHVTVENEAGVVRTFEDKRLSTLYGQRRLNLEGVPIKSPLTVWYRAEREVWRRGAAKPYVDEIVLKPVADGVGFDNTLALDYGDHIAHARRAPYGGGVVTDQLEVVGIRHRASRAGFADWETILRTRPRRRVRRRLSIPDSTAGATTPDAAANSLTTGLDLRARLYRNDWRGAGFPMLIGKWFDLAAYVLHFTGDKPLFEWADAGGVIRGVTGPSLRRAGARPIWLRGTLKIAAPFQARLWASEDGYDWRILAELNGAADAATTIRDTASELRAGVEVNGGAFTQPLNGRLLYAEGRGTIDGPVAFRLDADEMPATADRAWVSSTGETWTLRAGTVVEEW